MVGVTENCKTGKKTGITQIPGQAGSVAYNKKRHCGSRKVARVGQIAYRSFPLDDLVQLRKIDLLPKFVRTRYDLTQGAGWDPV